MLCMLWLLVRDLLWLLWKVELFASGAVVILSVRENENLLGVRVACALCMHVACYVACCVSLAGSACSLTDSCEGCIPRNDFVNEAQAIKSLMCGVELHSFARLVPRNIETAQPATRARFKSRDLIAEIFFHSLRVSCAF